MNKPMTDLIEQLVAQARRKSDVIAINPIVEKVCARFPKVAADEIAALVLRTILAAGAKVVWETPGSHPWLDPDGDDPKTLH